VKEATKKNKSADEVNVAATGKLKKQLDATEEKLKTSLKSTREKANNSNSDISDSDEERVKQKDSDDEFDEFFDRTNKEKAIIPGQLADTDQVLTYTTLKASVNDLIRERDHVANLLRDHTQSKANDEDKEDELD